MGWRALGLGPRGAAEFARIPGRRGLAGSALSEYLERHDVRFCAREDSMAKGQQAPKTNNKPKLSVKEKKQKKKEKEAAKAAKS